NGTTVVSQASFPAVPDLTWRLVAAVDFNQDGSPDLLWRNTASGANLVWYLSGTTLLSQASLPAVADPTWRLLGARLPEVAVDVDGDRHPDLIWRNTATGANL